MKVLIEESTLTNIADAIRTKTETNDTMYPSEMAGKVLNINTGIDTSDATAEAGDILSGETAYVNGVKVIGTIPVKEAEEYTPSTEDQVINSGLYLNGNQTIKGDTNLLAENIKSGVTIFGVEGNMQEGIDISDGTATADDIMLNKTAYANNTKLVGTFTIDDELTEQSNVISEIKSELANVNVGSSQGHYIWEKRLATIESTGTQYIDTGIIPKVNKTKVILYNFSSERNNAAWATFFGSDSGDGANDSFRFRWYSNSTDTLIANHGNAGGNYYSNYIYSRYTLGDILTTVEYSTSGLYINGVLASASETTSPVDGVYPIYLFAGNDNGGVFRPSCMRISGCQIFEDNTLVRDLTPTIDSNGVICMYDNVEGKYYYNQGTGNFITHGLGDTLYITSSNENKYPDNSVLNGYHYDRIDLESLVSLPDPITAGETIVASIFDSASVGDSHNSITEMLSITVKRAGTYRVKSYISGQSDESSSKHTVCLYKNGVSVQKIEASSFGNWVYFDVSCQAGDIISLYGQGNMNYGLSAKYLFLCIDWDNGIAYESLVSDVTYSQIYHNYSDRGTVLRASGVYVTIPRDGSYTVTYTAQRLDGTNANYASQIYKNGTALENTGVTWGTTISDRNDGSYSGTITCVKGDKLEVYGYAPYDSEDTNYIILRTLRAKEVVS